MRHCCSLLCLVLLVSPARSPGQEAPAIPLDLQETYGAYATATVEGDADRAVEIYAEDAVVLPVFPLHAQEAPSDVPAPVYEDVEVTRDIMIPMRDGVRLAADLYRPVGAGEPLPVLLIRTPYDKENEASGARWFARRGYAVLAQDVRGKHGSEGEFTVQARASEDGYDTVDWAARRPWSNGRIGSYGCSYPGEVQYLLAKTRHPAHRAMVAMAGGGAVGPAGRYYRNFGAYRGGTFGLAAALGWFSRNGAKTDSAAALDSTNYSEILRTLPVVDMPEKAGMPPTDFEDFATHPPADPYWDKMGYLRDSDRFATPALHVNSWFDFAAEETLYTFNLMRRNAETTEARGNQFAIIAPGTHCDMFDATEHTLVGERDVGDARLPWPRLFLDWFDHWLKGEENGVTEMPRVRYFTIGAGGWHSAPSWPPPGMERVPYYLGPGEASRGDRVDRSGVLSADKPLRAATASFAYDPGDPFPSLGGAFCCTGNPDDQAGMVDQTALESRSDLLVYTSPPLKEPLTIAGPIRAVLHLSSDAPDTDVFVKLLDVVPEGPVWNVASGILRMRYREGMDRRVWMEPDSVYEAEIRLGSRAYRFPAGHRIRLYVTSSNFPMRNRNLNTGGDNATETDWMRAVNTFHYGPSAPSRVVLPVARSLAAGEN